MRVFFSNIGCKLNQAELEQMARRFSAAGHEIADSAGTADLHVVNSCTVTHVAARDSRKLVRRGKRINPDLRTVLTGCYVTTSEEEVAALCGVDLVIPNQEKDRLLERVQQAFCTMRREDSATEIPVPYVPLEFGNARASVKIEDGCNMRCAFCIIPFARGPQRSRPVEEIVSEVAALTAGGFQEVVITGVQISAYRSEGRDLRQLVERLLEETRIPRLRLTSIAPWQFDEPLVDLFSSDRICRHVHMSLQSGCATTLGRMRRPYSPEAYARLVDRLRHAVPGIAITTDVIVGFPGEDDREFRTSLAFVDEMEFARIHAFPFSPREGTEAHAMPNQVEHAVKRERMHAMLATGRGSTSRFLQNHVGSTAEVLWENRQGPYWFGTTDNYLKARLESDHVRSGQLGAHRLVAVDGEIAIARSIPDPLHEPNAPPRDRPGADRLIR